MGSMSKPLPNTAVSRTTNQLRWLVLSALARSGVRLPSTLGALLLNHPVVWLSALALLGGCASYDPNDYYDPNAIEKVGRITKKTVARVEPARSGETSPPIFLPLKGLWVVLTLSPESPGIMNIYEYVVTLPQSQTVSVFSEYPSFKEGECVKVFLSKRASYPRMAYGASCEK